MDVPLHWIPSIDENFHLFAMKNTPIMKWVAMTHTLNHWDESCHVVIAMI